MTAYPTENNFLKDICRYHTYIRSWRKSQYISKIDAHWPHFLLPWTKNKNSEQNDAFFTYLTWICISERKHWTSGLICSNGQENWQIIGKCKREEEREEERREKDGRERTHCAKCSLGRQMNGNLDISNKSKMKNA